MFHMALDVLGLQPDEVLHVEDSRTSDVGGATRLGIPVAWVNRTGKSATGDPVADYTVTSLNEVLTIVRSSFGSGSVFPCSSSCTVGVPFL